MFNSMLLLTVFVLLFASSFSKPLHVPEHCASTSGKLFRACIRQAIIDTTGMYINNAYAFDTW
ncbi:ORF3a [Pangolin coronavirus HKU4/P251T/pangolin/2018]|nr:ORF3a [Pangolin coronavirus HKU4/P251T/pangolin/2018]